ncbi:MAG: hypothetical protein HY049_03215 [Acidobacteria bacterium]|nr:hypothetical protein [Acidobacteriota bacterium]
MNRQRSQRAAPPRPARAPAAIAADAYGPDPATLCARVKAYVGLTDEDSALVAKFLTEVRPRIPEIIEDFYARIEEDAEAVRVLVGGRAQVERLKATLAVWLERTLRGPHDEEFAVLQAAIGARHVAVGLDQSFMVTGMNVFREHLGGILLRGKPRAAAKAVAIQVAYARVLDVSLALMLETYRVDWLRKILQTEQNATFKRLASIGEVAAVIAHETRNPLAAISGAIQVFSGDLPRDDPKQAIVAEILGQIRRLDERVNDLLIYARPATPSRSDVDPMDLIRTTARLLADDPLMKHVRVTFGGDRALPPFPMDGAQVQQVLVNLVLNAAQAMGGKGNIRISAKRPPAGGLQIAVEDDGPGVRADLAETIFQPFFSTRRSGTGLGLAISRKIAESHDGTLTLDLTSASGSRFVIWLPAPTSMRSSPQMR